MLSNEVRAQFPSKLKFLFEPHRYKVARGGRGSAKSWSFARALLIQAEAESIRIGCFREIQKSIKDSVHALLKDQIQLLGMGAEFEVLNTEIRCLRNDSQFLFGGLADHTVESIKSFEGLDRAWVEEGQTVSKKSWGILIPTIRKTGSEIWVSYNPDLDTDETHQRFTIKEPTDCVNVLVNYNDNPWFNAVLEQERLDCLRDYPKDYPNIWEGKCRPAAEGAIYYDEIETAQNNNHIVNVPYDPMLKVHVVFDLGWNDSMAISLVQKVRSEIRIIEYIEDDHKTLDYYSALLKNKNMNWGTMFLPHDGDTNDYKTGKSAKEIMTAFGWNVDIVPNIGVEQGIKAARMGFGQVYFDKDKTVRLVECLKRYKRMVNKNTNEPSAPLHDEYSHGADNFRYIHIAANSMTNDTWDKIDYPDMGIV
jgi:phage terminase large subunit